MADSIGAETGTAHGGPTAILNSVLKLDASRYYRGGYNVNLTLLKGTTMPEVVKTLVEGFFGRGGQELHDPYRNQRSHQCQSETAEAEQELWQRWRITACDATDAIVVARLNDRVPRNMFSGKA